jgi:transposase
MEGRAPAGLLKRTTLQDRMQERGDMWHSDIKYGPFLTIQGVKKQIWQFHLTLMITYGIISLLGGDDMTPITNEKRELLIAAKKRGEIEEDIAKWLQISKSSVGKIWKLFNATGSYLPIPYPGRKAILTAEKFEEVKLFVVGHPDATLDEIIEELSLPIHKSRLSVLLIEAGLSFKKRRFTPKNNNGKMLG